MRSLLCVGVPRDALIDVPENGFTSNQAHHGHGHPHNSPDFTPSTAAGRMRTAGRRLSLQISSRLGGRGDESHGPSVGAKFRRNPKRASLGAGGGISKKSIGAPAGFRHEQHIGFPGVVVSRRTLRVCVRRAAGGADARDADWGECGGQLGPRKMAGAA